MLQKTNIVRGQRLVIYHSLSSWQKKVLAVPRKKQNKKKSWTLAIYNPQVYGVHVQEKGALFLFCRSNKTLDCGSWKVYIRPKARL